VAAAHAPAPPQLRASRRNIRCAVSTPLSPPAAPAPPSVAARYAALFARGASGGCPALFLAPMEGLADTPFRVALAATVGGFDEACTEFIRIPGAMPETRAQMLKAAARLTEGAYDARELGDTPLAAQLMGSIPAFLGAAAAHLAGPRLSAHRVDLNCGCPANTVTGRGAGSSLLREPALLRSCVAAIAAAVAPAGGVASVKLRAGFDDASLFDANLEAALAAGAAFVTLHPRTRAQGYSGAADWALIARAVSRAAGVPVVGNGDVTSAARATALLAMSRCDGVMVGRGAATDPLIFRRIRALYAHGGDAVAAAASICADEERFLVEAFVRRYYAELALVPPPKSSRERGRTSAESGRFRTGKLKQLSNYLLRGNAAMAAPLALLLRRGGMGDAAAASAPVPMGIEAADGMAEDIVACVRAHWAGPPRDVLVDNFSSRTGYAGQTQRVLPLASALEGAACGCGGEVEEQEEEQSAAEQRTEAEIRQRALAMRDKRMAREVAWRRRHERARSPKSAARGAAAGTAQPPREVAPLQ
jgi:tRNA-dihydrouridine synthase C